MSGYEYRYEETPPGASEEVAAAVALRNASRSLAADPLRVGMGPTATQLRARVVEYLTTRPFYAMPGTDAHELLTTAIAERNGHS